MNKKKCHWWLSLLLLLVLLLLLFSFLFFSFIFFKGNKSNIALRCMSKNIASKEIMNTEHKAAQIAVLDSVIVPGIYITRKFIKVGFTMFWLLNLSTHARLIMHPTMKTVFSHKHIKM